MPFTEVWILDTEEGKAIPRFNSKENEEQASAPEISNRSPIQDRAHRLGRLMLRSILQKRSLFLQMEGNTAPGNQQAVDRAGSICPVFFSVSYFSTKIAVAISDQSIGIDLAPLRIPWKEIQDHLSLRERYDIETYRSDLTAEVCAIKWANKEALGKILGTGIALNPRKICLEKAEQKGVSFLNFCINGREPCVAAIAYKRSPVRPTFNLETTSSLGANFSVVHSQPLRLFAFMMDFPERMEA